MFRDLHHNRPLLKAVRVQPGVIDADVDFPWCKDIEPDRYLRQRVIEAIIRNGEWLDGRRCALERYVDGLLGFGQEVNHAGPHERSNQRLFANAEFAAQFDSRLHAGQRIGVPRDLQI